MFEGRSCAPSDNLDVATVIIADISMQLQRLGFLNNKIAKPHPLNASDNHCIELFYTLARVPGSRILVALTHAVHDSIDLAMRIAPYSCAGR
ncbi:MAG: hypothetical protein NVSMB44_24430 [Ktedonobacteraceae bacterium]